jgi:pyruvate/2-oxoglutarate dehydrogenase complex dihydrolipoamide dehydrogenase (E3) component
VIVGAGSAGHVAAGLAESLGRKTLVIHADDRGGVAPLMDQESQVSNALLHAASTISSVLTRSVLSY